MQSVIDGTIKVIINMKKILWSVAVALIAVGARADVLYWQVSSPTTTDGSAISLETFKYAAVYAQNDATGKGVYLSSFRPNNDEADVTVPVGAIYGVDFSASADDYTGMTFYIELYSADSMYKSSTGKSYSDLKAAGHIADFTNDFEKMNAWSGGTFVASSSNVPEPTSGMLLLVGAALLGLRRRKQA